MNQKRIYLSLLVMLALFVTACADGKPKPAAPAQSSESQSGKPAADQPKYGGTLVAGSHATHKSLAPYHFSSDVDLFPIRLIHEGLVAFEEGYKVVPQLAEKWDTSPDGLTWTFSLRKGVKWHDGLEFTAEDVKFSFETYKDPKTKALQSMDFKAVKEVQIKDKYTAVVVLSEPFAPFLRKTATQYLFPKHYHEKMTPEEYGRKPVGTGPYKLVEWAPTQYVKLAANNDYWGSKPYIAEIINKEIPEVAVRMMALRSGEIQYDNWFTPPEEVAKFKADKAFQVTMEPVDATMVINLNNTHYALKDKRVRQAIMMSLDREAIVRDLWKGLGIVATHTVSNDVEWFNGKVKTYKFDQDGAKKLLDEAGWKPGSDGIRVNGEGKRLEFTILVIQGDEDRGNIAVTAQQWLKQVGIEMKIERNETGMLLEKIWNTRKFDAAIYTWTLGGEGGDPDLGPQWACKGNDNQSLYCDAEMDKLIDDGAREMNWEKRKAIYARIQEKLAEDVPMIFLMHPLYPHASSAKLVGFKDGQFNTREKIPKAYLKE